MKGYRFYLEFDSTADKRKGVARGKCMAVLLGKDGKPLRQSDPKMVECIAGVYDQHDSVCGGTSASRDYLRKNCKRVSENKAREIHPSLLKYLEMDPRNKRSS